MHIAYMEEIKLHAKFLVRKPQAQESHLGEY
jgi:hypothetical protein